MTLLGYMLVLTGVLCCIAAPASDSERPKDSCIEPQRFNDKELQGEWNEEFYAPGTQAQYSCRPGYIRLGAIRYVCSGGKWETIGTVGQCKRKSCGHPGDIEFGTFELKKEESFVFGAVVEYTCNEGYQMISKHRTRECSATGWTNYRPECEVRFCPPVQVGNNVNLLTTSYEEEYSVGQVIRFECKTTNQKLNGASEIFCTSEGDWNAPPPTCEEIKCSPPQVVNGRVSKDKPSYKDKERLAFSCENGYKPSATTLTCTKYDWSPTPICEEIVCYPQTVKDGSVKYTKEMYRLGDTVTLECKEGYQIEYKPDEPRECTAHGWDPPLKCISKICSRPNPQNARIDDLSEYGFPMTPGYYSWFYYYCDSGFLSSEKKTYWGKTSCTKTGWNPEPKCYKKCNVPPSDSINAHISQRASSQIYIEGEKLRFQCYKDFKTSNGQTTGEMECHPDGYFLGEKCSKTCQKPNLVNGKYETNENVFDVGAYLLYKCEEGFISSDNKAEGISLCRNNGWQPEPECREIVCTLKRIEGSKIKETEVRFGNVVHFKCPENWTLEGSSSLQCFHYGWSSAAPMCRDDTHESFPILDLTSSKESKCPPIPTPSNARVINPKIDYFDGDEIEIECDPGYQLYGSKKGLCKDGKWQSPPWCIKIKRCGSTPPQIPNGKISEEFLANQYYSGSTVKYICANGYHISGSDESKCLDAKWLPTPTCEGNPCGKPQEISNGRAEDGIRQYKHRERAAYVCDKGYKLSQTEPATCYLGKWTGVPRCIYSSCGPPPKVTNEVLKVKRKATYLSGERATYECARGFTMGQNANYITCEDSVWTEPPVCRAIGQTCGAPPVVQFGDITEIKQRTYSSGSSVIYKCANYYKLEGNNKITCKDGEWEKEPVCREPCTVKEIDMQQNNIQRKWVTHNDDKTKKLYSEHFDNMTFECRPGYEISDQKLLRIQCLDGVLKYPKCLKEGSCVLQQTEMANNNIRYIKNTVIEHGQTIEFECVEGLKSQNSLQATCKNKQIQYPKCSAGQSCPPPDISNAILSPELQNGYESGSLVNIECKDTFKLSGHTNAKCENGQWIELPQCLKPCTLDPNSLERNHIELLPNESAPEILEHGREVNVKCKATFKRQGSLIAVCNDGVMKYQRCFSGGTCRIIQNDLDQNFLELDERHENEVFFEEGETVTFKCKTGYRNGDGLTGTCAKSAKNPAEYILTYPTCEQESAV